MAVPLNDSIDSYNEWFKEDPSQQADIPAYELDDGWVIDKIKDNAGNEYTFDQIKAKVCTGPENFTIYLKQTKATVKFESNGGTKVPDQTVNIGDKAVKPDDPTKTGNTFDNWYSDIKLTDIFSFDDPVMNDMTLYAKWSINKYTVTFETFGGTEVPQQVIEYNNTPTKPSPDPVKEGHTFRGWYNDKDYTKSFIFTGLFRARIKADTTVYAKWDVNTYTVTFDPDNGTVINPQKVKYGEKATEPEVPVKEGYSFKGWFEEGADKAFNFDTEIKSDVALKAKWDIDAVSINNGQSF